MKKIFYIILAFLLTGLMAIAQDAPDTTREKLLPEVVVRSPYTSSVL